MQLNNLFWKRNQNKSRRKGRVSDCGEQVAVGHSAWLHGAAISSYVLDTLCNVWCSHISNTHTLTDPYSSSAALDGCKQVDNPENWRRVLRLNIWAFHFLRQPASINSFLSFILSSCFINPYTHNSDWGLNSSPSPCNLLFWWNCLWCNYCFTSSPRFLVTQMRNEILQHK